MTVTTRWSGWVWGADVPPARYFANMAYNPLAVGLPAITATVTSGKGVGFHFNVSAGMIVGVAASCAAAVPQIAVDMKQATETAASIVRYAMASSRVILRKNIVHACRTPARRERAASGHAAAPLSAASNFRRPMVTVICPSRRGA